MNLNKVFLLGNLTRDPERRSLPSGQTVVSFGLATNRFYTDKEGQRQQDTQFHNISAFGKMGDVAYQYLKKGSLALIEGRLRTSSWEDQQGNRRSRTEIIANNLQLGPKGSGGSGGGGAGNGTPPSSAGGSSNNQSGGNSQGGQDIPVIEESPSEPSQNSSEKSSEQGSSKDNSGNNSSKDNSSRKKSSSNEEEINVDEIPF